MHVIIVLCRILLRISRRGLECDIGFVRHSCVIKLDRFFFLLTVLCYSTVLLLIIYIHTGRSAALCYLLPTVHRYVPRMYAENIHA